MPARSEHVFASLCQSISSLPQVKVKQHYFPIWNSRCSKLSCFSPSNICEWALKQVPRNNQVRRNVSRKRWKGKRALRDPLWRSIVLHILSISLLMISSQTDCGMRNISDLIFILLPALTGKKQFVCFDEIKMRFRSRYPMAAATTTELFSAAVPSE